MKEYIGRIKVEWSQESNRQTRWCARMQVGEEYVAFNTLQHHIDLDGNGVFVADTGRTYERTTRHDTLAAAKEELQKHIEQQFGLIPKNE